MMVRLTQSGNEEEMLHPVADGVSQCQVDKSFDVKMVHQGQPGVVLGLQGVRWQRACEIGGKKGKRCDGEKIKLTVQKNPIRIQERWGRKTKLRKSDTLEREESGDAG